MMGERPLYDLFLSKLLMRVDYLFLDTLQTEV
jgi:hypothetical protein